MAAYLDCGLFESGFVRVQYARTAKTSFRVGVGYLSSANYACTADAVASSQFCSDFLLLSKVLFEKFSRIYVISWSI